MPAEPTEPIDPEQPSPDLAKVAARAAARKAVTAPDVLGNPAAARASAAFEEIALEHDGDAVILTHSPERIVLQTITLGVSTVLFILFVIVIVPALNLTKTGTALWMLLALVVLAGIGLATQLWTRTTKLRLDDAGVHIDQGTPLDQEHIDIAWGEISSAMLEPVNPKDARKGMQLRIVVREGPPIDTLVDVGVGDLNEARRMIVDRSLPHRVKGAV